MGNYKKAKANKNISKEKCKTNELQYGDFYYTNTLYSTDNQNQKILSLFEKDGKHYQKFGIIQTPSLTQR